MTSHIRLAVVDQLSNRISPFLASLMPIDCDRGDASLFDDESVRVDVNDDDNLLSRLLADTFLRQGQNEQHKARANHFSFGR